MNLLEQAIIKTICYADIFDYPLTAREIFRYLIIQSDRENGKEFTFNSVATVISDLVNQNVLAYQAGFYFLKQNRELATLRQHRAPISVKKYERAQQIARKLARLPNILGIFVTGALGMANVEEGDDIDLLIITRANKLWTTRFMVTVYLELLRVRRKPNINPRGVADQVCVNLYLDEQALSLEIEKRNLYTAHEVIQVKPLILRDNIDKRFNQANRWVRRFLPNALSNQSDEPSLTKELPDKPAIDEKVAYLVQKFYMKRRLTRETVTPHMAFFHPRDTSQLVLAKYERLYQTIQKIDSRPPNE